MNEDLMNEIKKCTKEELEQKIYTLLSLYKSFDIKNHKLLRRLQYLNKNYTNNPSFYNTIANEYKKTNNKYLGYFLEEHYQKLESEAQMKFDLPKF